MRQRLWPIALFAAACSRGDGAAAVFHPLDVGAPVPSYAAPTLRDDTVRVGGNEQPTVLNVWATWCTSCREEMAALDTLENDFAARGVRVVAVSIDNGDIGRVRQFARSNGLRMIVAHDPSNLIGQEYAVVGVPTTFIIGRDGTLLWRHTGNISRVIKEARDVITKAAGQ
jgi:cytochrome c biogenesis protein CcmG/thiol:disulfide interchange protein DsbE